MKKLVFAIAPALACIGFASPGALRAQDQPVTLNDPAEVKAYDEAVSLHDARARAAALESFLKAYPGSAMKKPVLGMLVDLYLSPFDAGNELSAAGRLLEADPANLKAAYFVVTIEKAQGTKSETPDARMVAAAADVARKALAAGKPGAVSDQEWKNQTDAAYPVFYSAAALDAALRSDFATAVEDYNAELKLGSAEAAPGGLALVDTLQLARAYAGANSKEHPQIPNAIWFYARALDYFPEGGNKSKIELDLKYWYVKFHGGLDGLDDVKKLAAKTVFRPRTFTFSRLRHGPRESSRSSRAIPKSSPWPTRRRFLRTPSR